MGIRACGSRAFLKQAAAFRSAISRFAIIAVVLLQISAVAAADDANASQTKSIGRIFVTVFVRKDNSFENVLITVDPTTGKWQKFGDSERVNSVRVSPDAKTLLFAKHDDGIWVCAAQEGSEQRRLMYTGMQPVWSGDGTQVISHDGKYEDGKGWRHSNWRINADRTDLVRLPLPETDGVEDWSPDGQWVVTVSDRHPPQGSGYQLYVMRPDGTEERRITQDGLNVYSRFSPDSRSVVYTHQDKNGNSLWVVNVDGTNPREIVKAEGAGGAGAVGAACWSPDGKQLVVHRFDWELDENGRKIKRAGNGHDDRLEIVDADGKNMRRLTLEELRPLEMGHPDWR